MTNALPANAALASPSRPRRVPVELGSRSYHIMIGDGLLANAADDIAKVAPKARCAIVTDENVARHHLRALEETLGAHTRLAGQTLVLEPGEATKSFHHLARVCEHLLNLKLERGDAVIAFGGGVIGDLAGFAASILKRGVRLIQIPTTLLAQVDSSVGGKTGINTAHGKNLIGSFYQPVLVLADTSVLNTLHPREFRAGYAEIVKYGLLGDARFFDWLDNNLPSIFSGAGEARIEAIERSCRAKAAIVAEDEHETGRRALLNLGHTFGHALEAWAGYCGRLIHGEAVSAGMVLAFEFSERLGLCPPGAATRVAAHLQRAGLPVTLAGVQQLTGLPLPEPSKLLDLMAQDKKVKDGVQTLILVKGVGEAFISRTVEPPQILDFLQHNIALAAA